MSADKLTFRVERTEWAEIEVDVPKMFEEWGEPEKDDDPDAFVKDTLWEIGVQDLMYSGDFIRVMDNDTDEQIEAQ